VHGARRNVASFTLTNSLLHLTLRQCHLPIEEDARGFSGMRLVRVKFMRIILPGQNVAKAFFA